jgi:hypothetical protein
MIKCSAFTSAFNAVKLTPLSILLLIMNRIKSDEVLELYEMLLFVVNNSNTYLCCTTIHVAHPTTS